jgi:tRNA(Ile)-lysidine synthase
MDSMVLLHVLVALRARCGIVLAAAHVHHGLSPNADAWADFCRRQCNQFDVPLQVLRVEVARDTGAGLESAARDARLLALDAVAADWLVFAHHRDDQAETVLFRLARGAGVSGAAAMQEVEPGAPGRLRPLLEVRRRELAAWAAARRLEWVEDESNADIRHARNRLRLRVLPELEQAVPGASQSLARAAANFRDSERLLDDLAEFDDECARMGGVAWRRSALLAMPDRRLANLLRWRLKRDRVRAPSRAMLLECIRQLRAAAGDVLLAIGACALATHRDVVLWLVRADCAVPAPRAWDGSAPMQWGLGALRAAAANGLGLDAGRFARERGLVVRTRWPGLRMRVAIGRPRRTFKNLCQEAGIPEWLRPQLPVLCVDGAPVWIAGIGVAAEWRCPPGVPGLLPEWSAVGLLGTDIAVS